MMMPHMVEQDVALHPLHVRLLGTLPLVLEPYCIADLIQQFLGSLCHASLRGSGLAQGV